MGQPGSALPTAGGDAEEIERFKMIHVARAALTAGRIKIYSCDSVAGRAFFDKTHSPASHVDHEPVPPVREARGRSGDPHGTARSSDIAIGATGASIGAFHAVAVTCRFPDIFHRALGMSGTYDLLRFIEHRADGVLVRLVAAPLRADALGAASRRPPHSATSTSLPARGSEDVAEAAHTGLAGEMEDAVDALQVEIVGGKVELAERPGRGRSLSLRPRRSSR